MVVVGAGFGGLWAVKALQQVPVEVELIDRHNYHTFFPLLYQVAAAELAPGDIAHPVRKIIRRQHNTRFTLARATGIDTKNDRLSTDRGDVEYDFLIIATGSTTRFFDVPGAEENSFALRTLDQAVELRNHILQSFESAEHAVGNARQKLLTFVIVGGGPTGVEFSGALQELINGPLAKDHPQLDTADACVVLVEAGDRLLNVYPPGLSEYARRRLEQMGVKVRLQTAVAEVSVDGAELDGGDLIQSSTVVWTAGVGGPADLDEWGLPTDRSGRAAVNPDLTVSGHSNVFIVGDGSQPEASDAPMVAQNATQQGTLAARNVLRAVRGEPPETYRYRDLGNMAVIGRNAAVVHLFGRLAFKGYVAWLMWLALHLAKLIGFRNRVAALLSWSGDYLFRDRVARLITDPTHD